MTLEPIELPIEGGVGLRTVRAAMWLARWWAVALFASIGVIFTVNPPYGNAPPIRSDGLGYHAWTRAILDGHVSFCPYTEIDYVGAREPPSSIGRCANKYPPGLALLRFPVMAPFTATNGGVIRSDREDRVNQVLSLVAGAIAMSMAIAAAVRLGADRWLANFAALALMFGTNQFHYATYDGSFSHIYSAALVGALLLLVVRADVEARPLRREESVLVAGIVYFLVDIRMMLVAPLAVVGTGLVAMRSIQVTVRRCWERHRRLIVGAALGGALALVVQLLYNRYIFGDWRISSYAGEEFHWSQLKQSHVLFSTRRGVFLWSPVMALALAAIAYTRQWTMLATVVLATVTLAVIYGAWQFWDLAGGFGHRGFVEVVPLYAAGLGVALTRVSRRMRVAGSAAAGALALVTLGLMRGYWSGELGFYGATTGQFFDFAVGSRSFVPHYVRLLLS